MLTMNTKHIISSFAFVAAMSLLNACEKIAIPREELTPSYNQVYMAAAVRNPNTVTLKFTDTTYDITYGASFGGYGTAPQDISVSFTVDADKAAAYNTANNTSYPVLPAASYTIGDLNAVIPAGSVSTAPLAIKVNPKKGMVQFQDYILAITMQVKGDTKTNASLRTAYYIITATPSLSDYPAYSRTNWSIAGYSSQEPAEGATNGGLALHTIDGKLTTFWHTKWDGGNAPPPHWIAVDMGESKTIHGLIFTGRQSTNQGKPNTVQVDVSDNGTVWTFANTLTLANINDPQKLFVKSFPQGRYFRFTVLTNFGNQGYTHLAEIGAF